MEIVEGNKVTLRSLINFKYLLFNASEFLNGSIISGLKLKL